MRGTITKIHQPIHSRNGNVFIRVEFKMDNGAWAKTDLCPEFRNFVRWKDLLNVGAALDGLELKGDKEVNADSYPFAIASKQGRQGHYVSLDNDTVIFQLDDEKKDFGAELVEMISSLPDHSKMHQAKFL